MEIQDKNILNFEDLILKKEDGIDEEVTDIESTDEGNKRENNNVEILNICPQELNKYELSRS